MVLIKALRSAGVSALIAVLALSGCQTEPAPPCPQVRVDVDTARLTAFREGDGRDVTDIAYQVDVVGYAGQCVFKDDGVRVNMDVDFAVTTGPAAEAGPVDIFYFVAIPRFFPQPVGKKIFSFRHKLPKQASQRTIISQNDIGIFIPLEDKLLAAGYTVYVGLQLTPEQIDYNRARRR